MSDALTLTIEERVELAFSFAMGSNELTVTQINNSVAVKEQIKEYLLGDIGALPNNLIEIVGTWNRTLYGDESGFIDATAEGDGIVWKKIKGFFNGMFQAVWSGFRAIGDLLITDLIKAIKNLKAPYSQAAVRDSLKTFIDNGILDEGAIAEFEKLFGTNKLTEIALPVIATLGAGVETVKTIFNTAGGDFGKRLLKIFTPNVPPIESLIRLGFLSPGLADTVRSKLGENGLSEEDQNLIFAASLNMLDVEVLRILYLRKEISDVEVFKHMRQNGYTDDRTTAVMKTWEALPGIADIVHMVDREAFDPAIVSYYGYMEDSNKLPYEEFAKQGLSEFWVNKIWAAHWNTPSIGQGFEMLWRRIISKEELDDLFKTVEIPGFWRDKLVQLSYRPYTRVDARRMYGLGVLFEQDLYENYLDIGYDHKHALKMTEFTIKYEQDEDRQLTKGQIITFYKAYLLTPDEAKNLLTEIGYSVDRSDYFLTFADYEREQEYVDTVISNTGEMYTAGSMSYDEASRELYKLNLPAKRVSSLFTTWNIKIYKGRKLPSKTDLDKFYKSKIIDLMTYADELSKLGYPERYVNMYTALAEFAIK